MDKTVTTFCPECEEETLIVHVTSTGTAYCPGEVDIHWFVGEAKCDECGYVDENYSDSN